MSACDSASGNIGSTINNSLDVQTGGSSQCGRGPAVPASVYASGYNSSLQTPVVTCVPGRSIFGTGLARRVNRPQGFAGPTYQAEGWWRSGSQQGKASCINLASTPLTARSRSAVGAPLPSIDSSTLAALVRQLEILAADGSGQ